MFNTSYSIAFETNLPNTIANHDALHTLLNKHVSAYTLTTSEGAWHGVINTSYTVNVMGNSQDRNTILNMAHDLKAAYNQEVVLVTTSPINGELV